MIRRVLALLLLGFALLIGRGYWNATRDPIVRQANVHVPDWPQGAPPVRALLISDIHIAGPDMPPARVEAIAAQLNRLKPDLVLIAGDLVSDKKLATHIYTTAEIAAALSAFKARYGVVVAMGNHDHWFDESGLPAALEQRGVTVRRNDAVKRGPVVIGVIDDDFTHHADPVATFAAMDRLTGPRVILTHSPDIVPSLPSPVASVFAGHTHCGQALWGWSGKPILNVSRYGARFQCGAINDHGQPVFVGAGLGTSGIWLRYGAPPDVWLVTLGP